MLATSSLSSRVSTLIIFFSMIVLITVLYGDSKSSLTCLLYTSETEEEANELLKLVKEDIDRIIE